MKIHFPGIILFLLLLCLGCTTVYAKTYYVDAVRGNDQHTGLSIQRAWKTLSRVNANTFAHGDSILLKRGGVFAGALLLKGSGAEGSPIVLGSYGLGSRPVINGAMNDFAIRLLDQEYWEIRDVEATGAFKAGIFVGVTKANSSLNHFVIFNCYVHHVGSDSIYNWDFNQFTGGIVIVNGYIKNGAPVHVSSASISRAIVDACIVRYIRQWTCISISSGANKGGRGADNVIRNCTTEYSVADGIRMNGVRNSAIEYSVMYKNGAWPNTPNVNWGGLGAWFFEADDCAIQYCEASFIDNWHNDGGAFDIDYYQTNSIIQDCYGHDCHGYGISVFGADPSRPTYNSIVRNNVLRNNARDSSYAYQGDFYLFTWNGGLLNGVQVYNNTSFWNPVVPAFALKQDADYTGSLPNIFKNNIIQSKHPWLVYAKNDDVQLDSNVYFVENKQTPLWMGDSIKYSLLSAWQKGFRQDKESDYRQHDLSHLTKDSGFSTTALPFALPETLKGAPVLMMIVDPVFDSNSAGAGRTRSQLTFARSMYRQYREKGLKVIIASSTPANITHNNIQDFELQEMTVMQVKENRTEYSQLPVTMLISPDGKIVKRWNRMVLPANLAFSIESIIGEPNINPGR